MTKTEAVSTMTEDTATLTLGPAKHDKLGIIHCGVTREGFIAVGGDPRNIDDGEEILFERVGIKARRQGSEYTFTKII
ncbi:MAG: hypothetical protein U9Q19_11570 [Pseudomonadota bacterium]|nr:hypothetical protein [Pseudomonadota bacterium]